MGNAGKKSSSTLRKCFKTEFAAPRRSSRWKEVKTKFAAPRRSSRWKKVRQNRVCSTKKDLPLEGSASKRSLQHQEGPPAGRKCVKTKFAAPRRFSRWKEVRQNRVCSTKKVLPLEVSASKQSLQHQEGSPAGRKCVKTKFAAPRRFSRWKEVRQNRVCSTKKVLPLEGSASKWSLQHQEGSPAGRKCVKMEFAAPRRFSR
ncbi:hypothetical protein [Metabacillus idriensis]|uniref:hypothetical protein n=1 Tax=Metabacillus idriensis TaxID=324768 RepID=UPI00174DAF5D|nr:hypothetical protein [Metabacillus idriensis]